MNKKSIKKKKEKKDIDEKIGDTLTLRQETFCQLYATSREFFGNGVQSYTEAYKLKQVGNKWYKTACQSSSRLLSNVKVSNRITELLNTTGFNENFMDKQLLYVATQFGDLGAKVNAIKEFNKLKNRITERLEVTEVKTDPGVEEKSNNLLKTYLNGGTRTTTKKQKSS